MHDRTPLDPQNTPRPALSAVLAGGQNVLWVQQTPSHVCRANALPSAATQRHGWSRIQERKKVKKMSATLIGMLSDFPVYCVIWYVAFLQNRSWFSLGKKDRIKDRINHMFRLTVSSWGKNNFITASQEKIAKATVWSKVWTRRCPGLPVSYQPSGDSLGFQAWGPLSSLACLC